MRVLVNIITLLVLTVFAQAQTADEVVQKHIAAIGGADNWKALKGIRQSIVFSQQGLDILGFQYKDAANRESLHLEYNGMKYIEAFDGTTVWLLNEFTGETEAKKLDGAKAEALKDVHFVSEFIDYKENGHTVSMEGKEEIEGMTCYKIKFTRANGIETMHFFDSDSGFLVVEDVQAGERKIIMIYSEYQETGGIKVPMKQVQKEGEKIIFSMKIESLDLDPQLDDVLFVYPGN